MIEVFIPRGIIGIGGRLGSERLAEISSTQSMFIRVVISHGQSQLRIVTRFIVHDVVQRFSSPMNHLIIYIMQLIWGPCQAQWSRML